MTSLIQKNRIQKELDELTTNKQKYGFSFQYLDSMNGSVISLKINCDFKAKPWKLKVQEIIFDIYLNGKFPYAPPKFILKTTFTQPSLADGRDYVKSILKDVQWTPNITIMEIILMLPDFLKEVEEYDNVKLQQLGEYHLGNPLEYSTLNRETSQTFEVIELDPHNYKVAIKRILVITEMFILQFQPSNTFKDHGHLILWATLSSLQNFKLLQQTNDIFQLQWKQISSVSPWIQTFKCEYANELLQVLCDKMQNLGIGITSGTSNNFSEIREEEVTVSSLDKIKIAKILQDIEVQEQSMIQGLNLQKVEKLMTSYQQAIEYYSAQEDPRFQEFLNRLHQFLNRKDVIQSISQGQERGKEKQKKAT